MIYLDNAATTFPKPPGMATEITRCIREYCGNPGRSGHVLSLRASEKIYECRQALADLFGSNKPENVIFTLNTTYALNLAIKTLYKSGSHILISNMEHNSVLRPVFELQKRGEISYEVFNVMQTENEIIAQLEQLRKKNTGMLVMTHASNICGKLFPIEAIGKFCKAHNITFIVDAAQSAGVANIHVEQYNISALCAPAHKGLYGPQGLGFVLFGNKQPIRTLIEGGNGINSPSPDMGLTLPESFEGGTMPTPLIAGFVESINWLKKIGIPQINAHEVTLACRLREKLLEIPGSLLYGPKHPETGILLYANDRIPLNVLSSALDEKSICTRSGFHCAPLAHSTLHTAENGALRISFGYFNTRRDVDEIAAAIHNIYKQNQEV